jgi:type III pantothenate kinase
MLAIDIGNSKTKGAWFEGENIEERFIVDSRQFMDRSALKGKLFSQGREPSIAFSCVVPEITRWLRRSCDELEIPCFDVKSARKHIVTVRYAIGELGGDRLANVAAAFRLYEPPLLVVDFGTATTYNIVLKDGTFDGGAIAPGIKTCIDFLIQRSGLLPAIPLCVPECVAGNSSEDALVSGFYYTFTGQFKEISKQVAAHIGGAYATIGTGGMVLFAKEAFPQITVNRDLTLLGIRMLYEENREG